MATSSNVSVPEFCSKFCSECPYTCAIVAFLLIEIAILCSQNFRKPSSAARKDNFFTARIKKFWSVYFPGHGGLGDLEKIPTIEDRNYEARNIHELAMEWQKKHGNVVKEQMSDGTYIVRLFNFADFRTVYRRTGKFPLRKSHGAMRKYREERPDLYDNVGLGAGEGEKWWELRKLIPGGITESNMGPVLKNLEKVADDLIRILHIKSSEGEVELLPWLFRWALESIGILTCNLRLGALEENKKTDEMVKAATTTNEMIALTEVDPGNFDKHYKNLEEAQDFMHGVILDYVNKIDSKTKSKGMVKKLLEKGAGLKKAITLTMDMFQGAQHTVSLTVLMALYHLARNKDVQDSAREELEKQLTSKDSKYYSTVQNVKNIPPYLVNIIWETLRINPPIIGNGRVLDENLILGGYEVPKGTNVILHHQVACLQDDNFEKPYQFKPQRHTEHVKSMSYVFGDGKRICPGKSFAICQIALLLAKILRNFDIAHNGAEIELENLLHNQPKGKFYLRLEPIKE